MKGAQARRDTMVSRRLGLALVDSRHLFYGVRQVASKLPSVVPTSKPLDFGDSFELGKSPASERGECDQ